MNNRIQLVLLFILPTNYNIDTQHKSIPQYLNFLQIRESNFLSIHPVASYIPLFSQEKQHYISANVYLLEEFHKKSFLYK